MTAFSFAAWLLSLSAPVFVNLSLPQQWNGSICTGSSPAELAATPRCSSGDGTLTFAERRARVHYYWTSEDGAALRVGSAENVDRLDVRAAKGGAVSFTASEVATRNAQAPATLTIRLQQDSWTVHTTALRLSRLKMLYVPPGSATIAFDVAGFRPEVRRDIPVVNGKSIAIGSVTFLAMPRVRGIVVQAANGEPVAGAEVRLPDGTTAAVADAAGRFEFVPRSAVPFAIDVAAVGFASRWLPVRRTVSDFDLGEIRLARGSRLTLKVQRPCDEQCSTALTLFRRNDLDPRYGRWKSVAHAEHAGSDSSIIFEAVEPGDHIVLLAGAKPLQKMLVPVHVTDSATSAEIYVHEAKLKGTVMLGEAPLAHVSVELNTSERVWSGVVHTDDNGEFETTMWSPRSLWASVQVPGQEKRFFASKAFSEGDAQYWDIVVPARELVGRIIDAATGAPVAGAVVSDVVLTPRRHEEEPAKTDGDGHFRLPMLDAGVHRLSVSAQNYAAAPAIDVELAETERSRTVDIRLDRGVAVDLKVVNEQGGPAANAAVFDWFGPDGLSTIDPRYTDAFGNVHYNLRKDERRGLCILGRNGSFTALSIDANTKTAPDTPLPVSLPTPSASVEMMLTSGGKPVRGGMVLVRYEGMFLPPGFFEQIAMLLGTAAASDAAGRIFLPQAPPGVYEIWPFRRYSDYDKLLKNLRTVPSAAKFVAAPGSNRVAVKLVDSSGE